MKLRVVILIFMSMAYLSSCSDMKGDRGAQDIKLVKVSKEDVQAELETMPSDRKARYQDINSINLLAEELGERQMLYLEAKKRGIDKDSEYAKRFEAAKADAQKRAIKKVNGLQPWQRDVLIDYFLEKGLGRPISVTEKEIEDYYNANNRQVRISRIIARDIRDSKEVFDRIKKGEDFGRIAAQMSLDKETAKTGGDLGYFSVIGENKLPLRVQQIIAILKKGEIGGPVTMSEGIHIYKATDIKKDAISLKEARDLIYNKLLTEKKGDAAQNLLNSIRRGYKVEINRDALSTLVTKQQTQ